jgi:hypothetical protein
VLLQEANAEVQMQHQRKANGMDGDVLVVMLKLYRLVYKHSISNLQLISIFDVNQSGFLNREELTTVINQLDHAIDLKLINSLAKFLDHHQQGQMSVTNLVQSVYMAGGIANQGDENVVL